MPLTPGEIADLADIHFEGCRCYDCEPYNEWVDGIRARNDEKKSDFNPIITHEDLYGDVDNFDFDKEARILVENRRNESMERDDSAPSVEELKAQISGL